MAEIVVTNLVIKDIKWNRQMGVHTQLHLNPGTGEIITKADKVGNYAPEGSITVLWRYDNKDNPTPETVRKLFEGKV